MSKIKKEMQRFLIAGISAVATDFGFYYLLLNYLEPAVAKTISFLLGTLVAYIMNKYWTFEKPIHSYPEMLKFILLYMTTLFANVSVNEIILKQFHIVFLGFLIATGVSTILNFIGQKWWVFK